MDLSGHYRAQAQRGHAAAIVDGGRAKRCLGLDGIAWIVGQQRFGAATPDAQVPHSIRIGADILRLAIAFDDLKIKGNNEPEALSKLQYDPRFDPQIVRALATLRPEASNMELKAVRISDLATGMILQEEIRTNVGMLLVGRGTGSVLSADRSSQQLPSTAGDSGQGPGVESQFVVSVFPSR